MKLIAGRTEEQKILARKLASPNPELIAVYGRRRAGKTYLIRTFFESNMVFEMSGVHAASFTDQLKNFSLALGRAVKSPAPIGVATSWIQAFDDLDRYLLDKLGPRKPAVLFFDEFFCGKKTTTV
jgi:AAA+ ATPase superfamily predicted ATPase